MSDIKPGQNWVARVDISYDRGPYTDKNDPLAPVRWLPVEIGADIERGSTWQVINFWTDDPASVESFIFDIGSLEERDRGTYDATFSICADSLRQYFELETFDEDAIKLSKNDRLGQCYLLAGRWLMDSQNTDAVLVHGLLTNKFGRALPTIEHVWIEKGAEIWEPALEQWWPKDVFEALFEPTEHNRYTYEEVLGKTLETEHWGPWDEGLEKGSDDVLGDSTTALRKHYQTEWKKIGVQVGGIISTSEVLGETDEEMIEIVDPEDKDQYVTIYPAGTEWTVSRATAYLTIESGEQHFLIHAEEYALFGFHVQEKVFDEDAIKLSAFETSFASLLEKEAVAEDISKTIQPSDMFVSKKPSSLHPGDVFISKKPFALNGGWYVGAGDFREYEDVAPDDTVVPPDEIGYKKGIPRKYLPGQRFEVRTREPGPHPVFVRVVEASTGIVFAPPNSDELDEFFEKENPVFDGDALKLSVVEDIFKKIHPGDVFITKKPFSLSGGWYVNTTGVFDYEDVAPEDHVPSDEQEYTNGLPRQYLPGQRFEVRAQKPGLYPVFVRVAAGKVVVFIPPNEDALPQFFEKVEQAFDDDTIKLSADFDPVAQGYPEGVEVVSTLPFYIDYGGELSDVDLIAGAVKTIDLEPTERSFGSYTAKNSNLFYKWLPGQRMYIVEWELKGAQPCVLLERKLGETTETFPVWVSVPELQRYFKLAIPATPVFSDEDIKLSRITIEPGQMWRAKENIHFIYNQDWSWVPDPNPDPTIMPRGIAEGTEWEIDEDRRGPIGKGWHIKQEKRSVFIPEKDILKYFELKEDIFDEEGIKLSQEEEPYWVGELVVGVPFKSILPFTFDSADDLADPASYTKYIVVQPTDPLPFDKDIDFEEYDLAQFVFPPGQVMVATVKGNGTLHVLRRAKEGYYESFPINLEEDSVNMFFRPMEEDKEEEPVFDDATLKLSTTGPLLITHDDLDGAACAIVGLELLGDNLSIEYHNHDSLYPRIDELIEHPTGHDLIIISDMAPNEEQAEKIDKDYEDRFLVADHHASADYLKKYDWATFDTEKCGSCNLLDCLQAQDLEDTSPVYELQPFVDLVDVYDRHLDDDPHWEEADGLNLLFNHHDESRGKRETFIHRGPVSIQEEEKGLVDSLRQKREDYVKEKVEAAEEVEDDGETIVAVESDVRSYSSPLGNALLDAYPEVPYSMIVDPGEGKVGLYSKDRKDVSVIAKERGGGGHPNASGYPIREEDRELLGVAPSAEKKSEILISKMEKEPVLEIGSTFVWDKLSAALPNYYVPVMDMEQAYELFHLEEILPKLVPEELIDVLYDRMKFKDVDVLCLNRNWIEKFLETLEEEFSKTKDLVRGMDTQAFSLGMSVYAMRQGLEVNVEGYALEESAESLMGEFAVMVQFLPVPPKLQRRSVIAVFVRDGNILPSFLAHEAYHLCGKAFAFDWNAERGIASGSDLLQYASSNSERTARMAEQVVFKALHPEGRLVDFYGAKSREMVSGQLIEVRSNEGRYPQVVLDRTIWDTLEKELAGKQLVPEDIVAVGERVLQHVESYLTPEVLTQRTINPAPVKGIIPDTPEKQEEDWKEYRSQFPLIWGAVEKFYLADDSSPFWDGFPANVGKLKDDFQRVFQGVIGTDRGSFIASLQSNMMASSAMLKEYLSAVSDQDMQSLGIWIQEQHEIEGTDDAADTEEQLFIVHSILDAISELLVGYATAAKVSAAKDPIAVRARLVKEILDSGGIIPDWWMGTEYETAWLQAVETQSKTSSTELKVGDRLTNDMSFALAGEAPVPPEAVAHWQKDAVFPQQSISSGTKWQDEYKRSRIYLPGQTLLVSREMEDGYLVLDRIAGDETYSGFFNQREEIIREMFRLVEESGFDEDFLKLSSADDFPKFEDLKKGDNYYPKPGDVYISKDRKDVSVIAKERGGGGHPNASGYPIREEDRELLGMDPSAEKRSEILISKMEKEPVLEFGSTFILDKFSAAIPNFSVPVMDTEQAYELFGLEDILPKVVPEELIDVLYDHTKFKDIEVLCLNKNWLERHLETLEDDRLSRVKEMFGVLGTKSFMLGGLDLAVMQVLKGNVRGYVVEKSGESLLGEFAGMVSFLPTPPKLRRKSVIVLFSRNGGIFPPTLAHEAYHLCGNAFEFDWNKDRGDASGSDLISYASSNSERKSRLAEQIVFRSMHPEGRFVDLKGAKNEKLISAQQIAAWISSGKFPQIVLDNTIWDTLEKELSGKQVDLGEVGDVGERVLKYVDSYLTPEVLVQQTLEVAKPVRGSIPLDPEKEQAVWKEYLSQFFIIWGRVEAMYLADDNSPFWDGFPANAGKLKDDLQRVFQEVIGTDRGSFIASLQSNMIASSAMLKEDLSAVSDQDMQSLGIWIQEQHEIEGTDDTANTEEQLFIVHSILDAISELLVGYAAAAKVSAAKDPIAVRARLVKEILDSGGIIPDWWMGTEYETAWLQAVEAQSKTSSADDFPVFKDLKKGDSWYIKTIPEDPEVARSLHILDIPEIGPFGTRVQVRLRIKTGNVSEEHDILMYPKAYGKYVAKKTYYSFQSGGESVFSDEDIKLSSVYPKATLFPFGNATERRSSTLSRLIALEVGLEKSV